MRSVRGGLRGLEAVDPVGDRHLEKRACILVAILNGKHGARLLGHGGPLAEIRSCLCLVEEGVEVFARLEKELAACLERKGYKSAEECRGRLKEL